jgi:hypothetical protein
MRQMAMPRSGRHLWKSTNAGKNFVTLASAFGDVTSLTVSLVDPRIVYAGTREQGIFKSTTAGLRWSPVSGGLPAGPVISLVTDPLRSGTVYAGIYALELP